MSATGVATNAMKDLLATAYSTNGGYLSLLRALTLQAATSVGATSFQVDLAVQVGDKIVFDQGLATQEEAVVQAVTGTGPYTVTPVSALTKAHTLTGANVGLQSHIPVSASTVHEVAGITRVAAGWGSVDPGGAAPGTVSSSASPISVPSGSTVGSIAVFSALTAGTYYDATAVAGQLFNSAGSFTPTFIETVA